MNEGDAQPMAGSSTLPGAHPIQWRGQEAVHSAGGVSAGELGYCIIVEHTVDVQLRHIDKL